MAAGAAWRDTAGYQEDYTNTVGYLPITNTNVFKIEFLPLSGWRSPSNQSATVAPWTTFTGNAYYYVSNPLMVANGRGVGLTGTTGTTYQIRTRTNLIFGAWIPVCTNTITTNGFNLALPPPPTNNSPVYYRALWLP